LKRNSFFLLSWALVIPVFLLYTNCKSDKNRAHTILQKSIKSHGGMELWKKMKSINYLKKTTLYTDSGLVEQKISQKIIHQWKPNFTKITWMNQGKLYQAQKSNKELRYFEGNALQSDPSVLKQINKNLDASLYVFWQPFKLLDPAAKLEYVGLKKLLDTLAVHAIKVYYTEDKKGDVWTYFFDEKSYRLRATQVDHEKRSSLIINEEVEDQTGLFLNKKRKSYFLDSLGKINYLRAAYTYQINSFELR